ncbi:MAG: hypothetical protein GTO63_35925 [Anaerolineae bacterium]|nr:hypothetical protein [Anaerolineae bacterium]NIQ82914.1 hypothetical protein [Anaerolineae bacterium]
MSYHESVLKKIESSQARQDERKELWSEISNAYEEGGIKEVESAVSKRMEELSLEFEHLLEKLERML